MTNLLGGRLLPKFPAQDVYSAFLKPQYTRIFDLAPRLPLCFHAVVILLHFTSRQLPTFSFVAVRLNSNRPGVRPAYSAMSSTSELEAPYQIEQP